MSDVITMESIPNPTLTYIDVSTMNKHSSADCSILWVNVVFLVVIIITSALRFYVRLRMVKFAGWDDLLMFFAVLTACALSALCLIGTTIGLGQHVRDMDPDPSELRKKVSTVTIILYACYITYATAITLTKFSIIAFYLRIFPSYRLGQLLRVTGLLILALWITSVFTIIFQCRPINARWDVEVTNSKCINLVHFFYVTAAMNIATDVLLCIAPLPSLWKMHLPRNQRLIICVLFGFGIFACVASILRLSQLHHLSGDDVTYNCVGSLNWSVAELGTAIFCASIPTMRPLAMRLLPSAFLDSLNRSSEPVLPHIPDNTSDFTNEEALSRARSDSNVYLESMGFLRRKDGLPAPLSDAGSLNASQRGAPTYLSKHRVRIWIRETSVNSRDEFLKDDEPIRSHPAVRPKETIYPSNRRR